MNKNFDTIEKTSKLLPNKPTGQLELHLAAKMIDQASSTPVGNHSYECFFTEYSLMGEFQLLKSQNFSGIYVIPSAASPLVWIGVLFIRRGIYQGAVFRFHVTIPHNFPDGQCPKITFDPPVFHPKVDFKSGDLDLSDGFPKWSRNVNHIWQLLLYTRKSFHQVDTKNPSNPEAAFLRENDPELFADKVKRSIETVMTTIHDSSKTPDDLHTIRFSEMDDIEFEKVKADMLKFGEECKRKSSNIADMDNNNNDDDEVSTQVLADGSKIKIWGALSSKGFSWVKKSSTQPFSSDRAAIT